MKLTQFLVESDPFAEPDINDVDQEKHAYVARTAINKQLWPKLQQLLMPYKVRGVSKTAKRYRNGTGAEIMIRTDKTPEQVVALADKVQAQIDRLSKKRAEVDIQSTKFKDLKSAVNWAVKRRERIPQYEHEIATKGDHWDIYKYAEAAIGGRWPEAEDRLIASKPLESYHTDVPWVLYHYAKHIVKGRWPEAEAQLLKTANPMLLRYYAKNVIKGPWPQAEAKIAKDNWQAFDYAKNVLKGRFKRGEAGILSDPQTANHYKVFLKKQGITI